MKKKFSTKWKASKKPGKQRKYRMNTPLHLRKKFLSTNLSKELRKKYNKRNIPLKKGDIVVILKGKFKKKKGKVMEIKTKRTVVAVENIQVKKQDGSKVNFMLKPSNLQIVELNLEDKKRNRGFIEVKKSEIKTEKETPKEKNKEDKKETKKNAPKKTKSTQ